MNKTRIKIDVPGKCDDSSKKRVQLPTLATLNSNANEWIGEDRQKCNEQCSDQCGNRCCDISEHTGFLNNPNYSEAVSDWNGTDVADPRLVNAANYSPRLINPVSYSPLVYGINTRMNGSQTVFSNGDSRVGFVETGVTKNSVNSDECSPDGASAMGSIGREYGIRASSNGIYDASSKGIYDASSKGIYDASSNGLRNTPPSNRMNDTGTTAMLPVSVRYALPYMFVSKDSITNIGFEVRQTKMKLYNYWITTADGARIEREIIRLLGRENVYSTKSFFFKKNNSYSGQKTVLITQIPQRPYKFLNKLNRKMSRDIRTVKSVNGDYVISCDCVLIIISVYTIDYICSNYYKYHKGEADQIRTLERSLKSKFTCMMPNDLV